MSLPKELLEVLACPFCKSDVKLINSDKLKCVNAECSLSFMIKDNIPVMLIDEADKACPACDTQRELKDEALLCPKCNKNIQFRRVTPK